MLPESRILTCIDNDAGYAVHFFEGQKLIRDLALRHDFSPAGFSWFRDCVLSVQPMVSLLKQGEGFGFFLDGEEPRFKLNFETGFHGQMRAMLTPRAFALPPGEVHGTCRLVKIQPGREPFQSIVRADGLTLPRIINLALEASFQMQSEILVSGESDQSVMFTRLPDGPGGSMPELTAKEYRLRHAAAFHDLFTRHLSEPEALAAALAALDLKLLAARTITFQCGCTREALLSILRQLAASGDLPAAAPDEVLETRCEYCGKPYTFTRPELDNPPPQ